MAKNTARTLVVAAMVTAAVSAGWFAGAAMDGDGSITAAHVGDHPVIWMPH